MPEICSVYVWQSAILFGRSRFVLMPFCIPSDEDSILHAKHCRFVEILSVLKSRLHDGRDQYPSAVFADYVKLEFFSMRLPSRNLGHWLVKSSMIFLRLAEIMSPVQ